LMLVDRVGLARPLTTTRRPYFNERLSPDGKRLAFAVWAGETYIWLYDLERDAFSRLSSGGKEWSPIWTPDGARVTFRSDAHGLPGIFWQAADGSGAAERLTTGMHGSMSWSPDGKVLAYHDQGPSSLDDDLWLLSVEGDRKPRPFLATPALERGGFFSPDGRWIAYVSNETGQPEVYIQSFPGPGGRWQVSTEGGVQPLWARSGKEIFYRNGEKVMVVAVETQPTFHLSKPKLLFEGRFLGTSPADIGYPLYDVMPDGKHFVMIQGDESAGTQIQVVLNWAEELKAKIPPGSR
jgi:eukaryotic-like serine/threonine-protein kinase